jgi:glycosyltransferase involved in cell wall biosynthesis
MKLSVALLSYNRRHFLTKQLRSILMQTRLPDELIIGDDCSTDGSVETVADFAVRAPFPVHWYVNDSNYGASRNAERAIQACSGDVIAFCDDDDVCLPDKLLVTEHEFVKSAATGLMLGNSTLVDKELKPLGITLWDAHRFTSREAVAVSSDPICTLARHFIGYGHVIAFRASLKSYILPFPQKFPARAAFDVWLALVLATIADVVCTPEPLLLHRLHGGQVGGVQSLASFGQRIAEITSGERNRIGQFAPLVEDVIARVSALADTPLASRNLEALRRWAEHMKMQSELPPSRPRRFRPIARSLLAGCYHRYSRGLLTAARDLLILQ